MKSKFWDGKMVIYRIPRIFVRTVIKFLVFVHFSDIFQGPRPSYTYTRTEKYGKSTVFILKFDRVKIRFSKKIPLKNSKHSSLRKQDFWDYQIL